MRHERFEYELVTRGEVPARGVEAEAADDPAPVDEPELHRVLDAEGLEKLAQRVRAALFPGQKSGGPADRLGWAAGAKD
ncbi:MAG TPA: hypothetical protein VFU26_09390 [Gaiellaceae bacterium]|nr:hypothetical protein [Gaiellaceae bacterium]